MSLITRCPVCETMFKVVDDQFKVAQGWVRCGHCGEVFDAALHLVPADAASPAASLADAEARKEPVLMPDRDETDTAPAASAQAAEPTAAGLEPPPDLNPPKPAEPAPEVSFVRDARRRAFWEKPLVRGLLGLLSLALLAALLLQWVLQQKDNLAALNPQLAPFLQALCEPLNCQIRPPRHIESLVIDSSSFSKVAPDVYRLSFVLKNNSPAVLEIPYVEVSLTDLQEQALVRRVLAPQEFGAGAVALAAHAELAAVMILQVSGEGAAGAAGAAGAPGAPAFPASSPMPSPVPLPITGYRILAFYP